MHPVPLRRLGDVDREVADAFEIGVDLDRREDRPQVGGHRLVQREQPEAAVVDLDVQLVDRLVADQHGLDLVEIALGQTVHRSAHALLGEPAHLEQPRREQLELVLEMSCGAFHQLVSPTRTGR